MHKIFIGLFVGLVMLLPIRLALAADQTSHVLIFTSNGCLHCEEATSFLTDLSNKRVDFNWRAVLVNEKVGRDLFSQYQAQYHYPASAPVILIDDQADFSSASVLVGFNTPEDTGANIERALDGVQITSEDGSCSIDGSNGTCAVGETVSLPFVGTVDLNSYSLPVVSVLFGLADGFNPCAMWALIALLGFLLSQKSRRKLVLIGGAFMITSYAFSWIVLFGWFKAFSFAEHMSAVGFLPWWSWLEYLILILALMIGINLLKSGLSQQNESCVVEEKKVNITKKMSAISKLWLPYALLVAVFLAIFVNLIELLCSLGLPVIYTKYLNDLMVSDGQAAAMVTLYNIFYMLDDILVFLGAVFLAKVVFMSSRFSKWVKIFAGLVIIVIIIWRLIQLI